MAWLQLHMTMSGKDCSAVESTLEKLGSLSITLADAQDQPFFEPAPGEILLWDEINVTALFDDSTDPHLVHAVMHDLDGVELKNWRAERLEDEDWERRWMDEFSPIHFGGDLWVCPSWLTPPEPEAINLMLDPGLAFGSGTHETTALCLEWLADNDVNGADVIDYGCGSGILAIAALKLGARHAIGIDIDPQALVASHDNADKNQIARDRFPVYLPGEISPPPCDLMLANILSGPLVELAPTLAPLTKAGGRIVLSGILKEQAENVCEAYAPWFQLDPVAIKGDWCRITGRKKTGSSPG